jgi:hypothetical protein
MQAYVADVGAEVGESLGRLLARIRDVREYLDGISTGAVGARPHLVRAAACLCALGPAVQRATRAGDEGLDLAGLHALAEELRQALPHIEEGRLHWATDVLMNDQ